MHVQLDVGQEISYQNVYQLTKYDLLKLYSVRNTVKCHEIQTLEVHVSNSFSIGCAHNCGNGVVLIIG